MLGLMAWSVLLVEAETALSEEIRQAFGPAGFQVSPLATGEAAVERCRSLAPDLILLSAELPDMSGFSVCNRLKRVLPATPVVLYTREAVDAAIEAHRSSRGKADAYLRCPLAMPDLLAQAAQLLQGVPQPAAPRPAARPAQAGPPVIHPAGAPPAAAPASPRPGPPPVPRGLASAPAPAPHAGTRPASPSAPGRSAASRVEELLAEWPRDPTPPKGTPEEKLEFFRERLRVKDAFVGRVREIRTLIGQLELACAGKPRLVAVVGEAGIGKTALVRQLLPEVRLRGGAMVTGRCLASDVKPPYGAWSEVLEAIHALNIVPAREWKELARLVPALANGSSPVAAAGSKYALLAELSEYLRLASARVPLTVVLDWRAFVALASEAGGAGKRP